MKNIKFLILVSLFIIVAAIKVNAFGVTSFYTDQQPLIINPGETRDIYLELQNMVGNDDITMKADLVSGSEIAEITDKSTLYNVPIGKKDVRVNIRIVIPNTTPIGQKYSVGLKFKQTGGAGGGMVAIGGEIAKSFPVVIGHVNPPEVISGYSIKDVIYNNGFLLAGLIVLIIIGYVVVRNIKKKRQSNL